MARRSSLKPVKVPGRSAPWKVEVSAELSENGKRQRLFFESKQQALGEIERLKARRDNFGVSLNTMSAARIAEAAEAFKILDPIGVNLLDAVRSYARSHKARTSSVPFLELFNAYLDAKSDRNPAYLSELRITRDRWPELHQKLACDISSKDLEAILNRLSNGARNPVMRYWRAAFNFGVKRGFLSENPIDRLDFATRAKKEVETIPTDKVRAMLDAALADDLPLVPYLTFGLFAGVRPEDEAFGLEWRDFDERDGVLTIRPEISKTARRRFIKLQPNALEWLRVYRERGGDISGAIVPYAESPLRTHRLANRAAAGVEHWPNSAMRHTFCSNHLAKFEDVNALTLMTGHTSPTMLWNHYYKAVRKEEAERYWQIMPPAAASNVIGFSSNAA